VYRDAVTIFTKILRWLRPVSNPQMEAEAERRRVERETIRSSQLPYAPYNVPPTPDITDPRR